MLTAWLHRHDPAPSHQLTCYRCSRIGYYSRLQDAGCPILPNSLLVTTSVDSVPRALQTKWVACYVHFTPPLHELMFCTTNILRLCVKGVIGILLEVPFYGCRRPAAQKLCYLRELHHAFAQVYAASYEAACLLHWAKHTWRLPLAATGVSAGGAMAGLAAKFFNGPLAVVPYMGCAGPAEPFTEGGGLFQVAMLVECCSVHSVAPCSPPQWLVMRAWLPVLFRPGRHALFRACRLPDVFMNRFMLVVSVICCLLRVPL